MTDVIAPVDGDRAGLRRMSIPTAIACALASSTFVIYLVLLTQQGTPLTNDRVLLVSGAIALLAVLTGVAALTRQPRLRTVLLGIGTPGLLGVGFIGAWSIGLVGAIVLTGITWGTLTLGILLTDPGRT